MCLFSVKISFYTNSGTRNAKISEVHFQYIPPKWAQNLGGMSSDP